MESSVNLPIPSDDSASLQFSSLGILCKSPVSRGRGRWVQEQRQQLANTALRAAGTECIVGKCADRGGLNYHNEGPRRWGGGIGSHFQKVIWWSVNNGNGSLSGLGVTVREDVPEHRRTRGTEDEPAEHVLVWNLNFGLYLDINYYEELSHVLWFTN